MLVDWGREVEKKIGLGSSVGGESLGDAAERRHVREHGVVLRGAGLLPGVPGRAAARAEEVDVVVHPRVPSVLVGLTISDLQKVETTTFVDRLFVNAFAYFPNGNLSSVTPTSLFSKSLHHWSKIWDEKSWL